MVIIWLTFDIVNDIFQGNCFTNPHSTAVTLADLVMFCHDNCKPFNMHVAYVNMKMIVGWQVVNKGLDLVFWSVEPAEHVSVMDGQVSITVL